MHRAQVRDIVAKALGKNECEGPMAPKLNCGQRKACSVPPLSQSRRGDMACEILYVHKHVRRAASGESGPAARGIAIHDLLSTYIDHLVATKRTTDLELFDKLTQNVREDAREVLDKFRNNHAFDPEKIVATELYIALDEEFRPIEDTTDDRVAAYEGTLDLVMLNSLTEADIGDWKSYFQIIEADTFQSKLYPLLLMCLNPALESVKFTLEFIRYGASRCVEYTRDDVPWLMELARNERTRQKALHQLALTNEEANLKASPGRHCCWCPLLLQGCPIARTNPYAQMTGEERLRFALWLQEAEKENTRVLKELLVEAGPARYADDNQKEYAARFVPVEKRFYPYRDAAPILERWRETHSDDQTLLSNLSISGLSSLLKADKRQALATELAGVVEVRVDTELKVGPASQDDLARKEHNHERGRSSGPKQTSLGIG
jgi:hypothetical protein